MEKRRIKDFRRFFESVTKLTLDDWTEKYTPVANHLDDGASMDLTGDGKGNMFETYGKELEYVMDVFQKTPNKVWTIVEGDDDMYIEAGLRTVNKYGFLITTEEWSKEDEMLSYAMEMTPDEDDDEDDM
jgi:hypothetical protein